MTFKMSFHFTLIKLVQKLSHVPRAQFSHNNWIQFDFLNDNHKLSHPEKVHSFQWFGKRYWARSHGHGIFQGIGISSHKEQFKKLRFTVCQRLFVALTSVFISSIWRWSRFSTERGLLIGQWHNLWTDYNDNDCLPPWKGQCALQKTVSPIKTHPAGFLLDDSAWVPTYSDYSTFSVDVRYAWKFMVDRNLRIHGNKLQASSWNFPRDSKSFDPACECIELTEWSLCWPLRLTIASASGTMARIAGLGSVFETEWSR
jgi:hypothetical protein